MKRGWPFGDETPFRVRTCAGAAIEKFLNFFLNGFLFSAMIFPETLVLVADPSLKFGVLFVANM